MDNAVAPEQNTQENQDLVPKTADNEAEVETSLRPLVADA